jgi:hypothetical protein
VFYVFLLFDEIVPKEFYCYLSLLNSSNYRAFTSLKTDKGVCLLLLYFYLFLFLHVGLFMFSRRNKRRHSE